MKTNRIKSITFDGLDLHIAAKSKFTKNQLIPRLISAPRGRKRSGITKIMKLNQEFSRVLMPEIQGLFS